MEDKSAEKNGAFVTDHELNGYVMLKPKEGWKFVGDLLKNVKSDFLVRYCCLRSARYFYSERPGLIARKELLQLIHAVLDQQDMADFAVEDLRNWQCWETTDRVLALWGRKTHDSREVRRAILRFALQSPAPQAARFVARQRQRDPEWVAETQETLAPD